MTALTTFCRRYAALMGDAVALLSLLLIVGGIMTVLGAFSSECVNCGAF